MVSAYSVADAILVPIDASTQDVSAGRLLTALGWIRQFDLRSFQEVILSAGGESPIVVRVRNALDREGEQVAAA